MSMRSEFQEFVANGNMVDIAVGFVMGAIFRDLVTSLVDNIIDNQVLDRRADRLDVLELVEGRKVRVLPGARVDEEAIGGQVFGGSAADA